MRNRTRKKRKIIAYRINVFGHWVKLSPLERFFLWLFRRGPYA